MTQAEIEERVAQIMQGTTRDRRSRGKYCAALVLGGLGLLGVSGALWAHRAPTYRSDLCAYQTANRAHSRRVARRKELREGKD